MKKTILILLALLSVNVAVSQQVLPYQNPSLPAEVRADDLLGRLSLDEKISLMMDESPEIKRLGIPQFQWWNEALHGVGRNGTSTVFPITMGMAASWDDDLLYKVYDAVSDEARAKAQLAKSQGRIRRYQSLSFWTPNINLFRDPRWGRGQETYGEDPYLTSRMGVAVVRGLQGPDTAHYRKTLACAKHFAVHSGPEWNRHSFNIENLPLRDLYETYIPAFKALVQEANVEEVMCAYHAMDGEPCCGSSRYLGTILREQLGFKGLVTSDCWAVNDFYTPGHHAVVKTEHEAAAMALRAGTDVECGPVFKNLKQAVEMGEVDEKRIDQSLRRLIIARIKLGDLDKDDLVKWTKIPESVIASPEHQALALKMAQESIVLLQNNGNVLPLSKDLKNIVVIGPNAVDSIMLWGNYNGFPKHTVTILDGLRQKNANIRYIQGCNLTSSNVVLSKFGNVRGGVSAQYWNNEIMKGEPVAEAKYSAPIRLQNGGATVFAPGVSLQHFLAKMQGVYVADKDETIYFNIKADDEAKLTVKDVTTKFTTTDTKSDFYVAVKVKKGEELPFVLEYKQVRNLAMLNFDITVNTDITVDEILAATANADAVIFVGGISPQLEGEEMEVDAPGFKGGDRTDIELPQVQRDLMASLHKNGRKIVFVNCSGGAIALEPETQNCDAILQAWYLGEKGGEAVADVIFGDVNPSGKLPVTFYRNVNQLPDFLSYEMKNRTYRYMTEKPLFAFGHGLSYSKFKYSKVSYSNGKLTCQLQNTSSVDGDEVVQVYLRKIGDNDGPSKQLRAFKRVSVPAKKTVSVTFDLTDQTFEWWDPSTNTMRTLHGDYEVMVGGGSDNVVRKMIKW
ncbi:MAG: glycoside hydrolase family 3 C-terminal domain-containing protein [Bacteroidales bacterium]|nr:glycoside hydrolase family 3 C-terminal domain-containing protein [Bacteroidales bacterium]